MNTGEPVGTFIFEPVTVSQANEPEQEQDTTPEAEPVAQPISEPVAA